MAATSKAAWAVTAARLGAAALAVAGVLFVLYPAIRPFSDEASLGGAAAFASDAWVLSHSLGIAGFTLLPLGLWGLHSLLAGARGGRAALWALVAGVLGAGLTLPFYGAETFGLNVIGQEALRQQDAGVLAMAEAVRSGPGLLMFAVGLLLVAVAAILAALAAWRSGRVSRWGGALFALGFALYIPQFFFAQPVRVAHGLLVAAGCLWLAFDLWREGRS
jgi:hypothetical protein